MAQLCFAPGGDRPDVPRAVQATGENMSDENLIHVYDSQGTAYSQAFDVFLAHTDQKANASAWLEQQVAGLARSEVFVDAGRARAN